ncbi:glycoside hydrolase superfamily [Lipomyces doorenjongii]|uniref:glycoside hydrolase superfamily n=1 Tax=Lipomyces doorenjongii TaxID=383834 RepID=UPI0034CEF27D
MRFASAIAALTSVIGCVSAIGSLGFDLGVQRNYDAGCKTTSDYLSDFSTIGGEASVVRVYAASDCSTLANILPAIKQSNFKLFVGVWPTDDAHYAAEKAALSAYLPTIDSSYIIAVTVGSEALYRGDLPASDLASRIDEVRTLVHGISGYENTPVGTVDSWNVLVDGANAEVIQTADIVIANAFSYWQGQTMANSSYSFFDDIMQALQVIQTTKGSTDITFWVGETGWPTGGGSFENAVPSVDNAAKFWQESVCGIRAWGINTLVFEAFDESWKPATSGIQGVETHWGVWTNDNTAPKFSLNCAFA